MTILERFPGILDECRDRHRADASWNWSDCLHVVPEILIVCISATDPIDKSRTYINHNRLLCYHISCEEPRRSSCYDDDIGFFCDFFEVLRSRVAARDRGSGIGQHECHRLAHDIGSADHDHIHPSYIDLVV